MVYSREGSEQQGSPVQQSRWGNGFTIREFMVLNVSPLLAFWYRVGARHLENPANIYRAKEEKKFLRFNHLILWNGLFIRALRYLKINVFTRNV